MTPREFQDVIDDGMRVARRAEASKPPRPRREIRGKLHRYSCQHRDSIRVAACGAKIYRKDRAMLSDAQFAWLPRRLQCESCLRAYWPDRYVSEAAMSLYATLRSIGPIPPAQRSATHEMELIVETLVLAIHRIGQTDQRGGHRCFHRSYRHSNGLSRCQWHEHREAGAKEFIGKRSALDVREWWYPVYRANLGERLWWNTAKDSRVRR